MIAVVSSINAVLTFLFGLVYEPLKWLGPFWSMAIISWLAGMLMVWIFGKVSNQAAIQRTRDRLSAELIGLRLFKDDLRVFFGIQGQILVWTLKYLRHSLAPMLILMGPTLLILIQLNLHYGARPLRVGEQALVKVKVREAAALSGDANLTLTAPETVKVETAGVRIPEQKEICWRVRGISPGRSLLLVDNGKEQFRKQVAVGGRLEGVCTMRTGQNWLQNLLYPGERPLPGTAAIESIEVVYPALEINVLGKHMDWLILFLVLSLGFGYACKGLLGVKI